MDPLTHGAIGAAAAHAVFGRRLPRSAWIIGALAGMAPDLDVLVVSASDPTLAWVWHRGVTHSLFFAPIGGLICGLIFLLVPAWRRQPHATIGAALLGYALHAPLDLFTSYGTLWFAPVSNVRVHLDLLPIIDPLLTLLIVAGVAGAVWWRRRWPAVAGLAMVGVWIGLGAVQHARATEAVRQLAAARGDTVEHIRVMPSPGSLVLWRSLYRVEAGAPDGRATMQADAVRTGYFSATTVKPGQRHPTSRAGDLGPQDEEALRQFAVLEWFSDGFLGPIDGQPRVVGDMRIGLDTAGFAPMWGLDFRDGQPGARRWRAEMEPGRVGALWRQMWGRDGRFVPASVAVERVSRG